MLTDTTWTELQRRQTLWTLYVPQWSPVTETVRKTDDCDSNTQEHRLSVLPTLLHFTWTWQSMTTTRTHYIPVSAETEWVCVCACTVCESSVQSWKRKTELCFWSWSISPPALWWAKTLQPSTELTRTETRGKRCFQGEGLFTRQLIVITGVTSILFI